MKSPSVRNEIIEIGRAIQAIRNGSIETRIHNSKVVQIEIREKIRFESDKAIKESVNQNQPNNQRIHQAQETEMKFRSRFLYSQLAFVLMTIFMFASMSIAEDKQDPPIVQISKEGFSLKSADQKFSLKIGGYIQADSRFFLGDDAELGTDTFLLRRARIIIESTFYKSLTFRFMPDFGGGSATIQDAYLEWHHFPEAKVRIGKFKSPVSLERLQSATNLLFVERAFPSNLVPNRDIGIQLSGDFHDSIFHYSLALLNGIPDGTTADLDTNDGKDVEGRIFINSNAKTTFLAGAGFGIGGTYGEQTKSLPSYKSPGQLTFFTYNTDAVADGTIYRIAPQFQLYNGPITVLGEYVLSSQEVRRLTNFGRVRNRAWQVSGASLLTGEKATPKTLEPKNPFDPSQGTWGALELAFRYSVLDIDGDAFTLGFSDPTKSAESAKAWAAGVNWYWNRNAKVVFNYEHTNFEGGILSADRESENAFLTRFQLAF